MQTFETDSLAETYRLGGEFAERLGAGDCVALLGPLGAGKTALVRGIAMGLGIADERLVSSPSYVLVQEYPARVEIHHVDLYRLADAAQETADLPIDEMLARGVVLIEWADRAPSWLPRCHWQVRIEITGTDSRRFTIDRIE